MYTSCRSQKAAPGGPGLGPLKARGLTDVPGIHADHMQASLSQLATQGLAPEQHLSSGAGHQQQGGVCRVADRQILLIGGHATPRATPREAGCWHKVSTQAIFWIYANFACALSSADAKTQLDCFEVAGTVVFDRRQRGGAAVKFARDNDVRLREKSWSTRASLLFV